MSAAIVALGISDREKVASSRSTSVRQSSGPRSAERRNRNDYSSDAAAQLSQTVRQAGMSGMEVVMRVKGRSLASKLIWAMCL